MTISWGPAEDHVILVTLLQHAEIKLSQAIMKSIADNLNTTPKAVSHRIAKIKKMVADGAGSAGASGTDSSPTTGNGQADDEEDTPPKKRKRTAKDVTPTKKTAKKNIVKVKVDSNDDAEVKMEVDGEE